MPMLPDGTPLPYPGEEQMAPPAPAPEMGGGGGGLPPELMALLGAGGGAPQGPPPSLPEAPEAGAQGGDPMSRVKAALDQVISILAEDGLSEQEKQAVSKAESLIRGVLAGAEKDQDAMLSGKISPSAMRRAAGGSAAA